MLARPLSRRLRAGASLAQLRFQGTFRAVEYVRREGEKDQDVRVCTRPRVSPLPQDHVRLAVAYAGVGRPDIIQRTGMYPPPPGVTDIPGLEVCGQVAEVAPTSSGEPSRWREGDWVAALLPGGGYAEECAAHAGSCLPLPTNLPQENGPGGTLSRALAAALPEALFTVWYNLFHLGRLQRGQSLLVHGASGGVGSMAVRVASARGVRVIGAASTPEKAVAVRDLGASDAVLLQDGGEPLSDAVRRATGGDGVDCVLDFLAGDLTDENLKCLSYGGRLVVLGLLRGPKSTVGMHRILTRSLTITGSTLRGQPASVKERLRDEIEEEVWPLMLADELLPPLAGVLPLEEARAAQDRLDERGVVGKLALRVGA